MLHYIMWGLPQYLFEHPTPPHHHQHHHQSGGGGGGGEGGVLLGLCTCFLLPKSVLCQWVKFISKEQKESFSSSAMCFNFPAKYYNYDN